MHGTIMPFLKANLLPEDIVSKRVLEIGSLNINGSPEEYILSHLPSMYIGIDEYAGLNVDIKMSGDHLQSLFAPESFDIVICLEVLEHAKEWRQLIDQIKYVTRPGGCVILTCRGPNCQYHGDPEFNYGDFYRFTISDMRKIFADFFIESLIEDLGLPGTLLYAIKPPIANLELINPLLIDKTYNPRGD